MSVKSDTENSQRLIKIDHISDEDLRARISRIEAILMLKGAGI